MTRWSFSAILIGAAAIGMSGLARVSAQPTPSLAGQWTLNRQLSQFPADIGFGSDLVSGGGKTTGSGGGGRGGSSNLRPRRAAG